MFRKWHDHVNNNYLLPQPVYVDAAVGIFLDVELSLHGVDEVP